MPPMKAENIFKEFTFFRLPQVSLDLKVNGVVRAEVVDVLPSGAAIVRIAGQEIELRTEIPLQKDTTLLLKILGMPDATKALKLQLLKVLPKKQTIDTLDLQQDFSLALRIAARSGNRSEALQKFFQKGLLTQLHRLNKEFLSLFKKNFASSISSLKELVQLPLTKDLPDIRKSIEQTRLPQDIKQTLLRSGSKQELLENLAKLQEQLVKDLPDSFAKKILQTISTKELPKTIEWVERRQLPLDSLTPKDIKEFMEQSGLFMERKLSQFVEGLEILQKAAADLQEGKTLQDIQAFIGISKLEESIKRALLQTKNSDELLVLIRRYIHTFHKDTKEYLQRDLKAKVTELLHTFPNDSTLHALHQGLQNYQLLSVLSGVIHFYFPVIGEDIEEGMLRIASHKGHFMCEVDLNFKDVGKIDIRMLLVQKSLKIDFYIENKSFRAYLQNFKEQLQELLSDFELFVTFIAYKDEKKSYTLTNGIDIKI